MSDNIKNKDMVTGKEKKGYNPQSSIDARTDKPREVVHDFAYTPSPSIISARAGPKLQKGMGAITNQKNEGLEPTQQTPSKKQKNNG